MLGHHPKAADIMGDIVAHNEELELLQIRLLRDSTITNAKDAFALGLALNREVKHLFERSARAPEESLIPESFCTLLWYLAEQAQVPFRDNAAGFFGVYVKEDIDEDRLLDPSLLE